MEKYHKIITELERFRNDVRFYFDNAYDAYGKDTTQVRDRITKCSNKIKRYLKDAGVVTSIRGRAAPVAGGFPFICDLIDDIFSNERTPYAVSPNLVMDALNKAIGVYEEWLESGNFPSSQSEVTNAREGFFVDGQYYDAQKFVRDLFNKSKSSIKIIDNYIDASVIDLLTSKSSDSQVQILTKKVSQDVTSVGAAFIRQHGKLSIRCSNVFHDRFIIIDDKEFYHLGASIKDLGKATFMFSKMEEDGMIRQLKDKFENEWGKGEKVLAN